MSNSRIAMKLVVIILAAVFSICLLCGLDGQTEETVTPAEIKETSDEIETYQQPESVETVEFKVEQTYQETEVQEVDQIIEEVPEVLHYTEQDIIDIAKVLYTECRGNKSKTEQACVAWTILNRVDMKNSNVHDVVRAPNQFAFYENTPVWDNLYELAEDVLMRWNNEKNGCEDVGRVLPIEYMYFHGANGHNWFKDGLHNYNVWDYSSPSPYET